MDTRSRHAICTGISLLMNTETFESHHSLADLILYNMREDREQRQTRLCDAIISRFADAWKQAFGPLTFEAEVAYDLDESRTYIAAVRLDILSVADNFRRLEGGGWGWLKPSGRIHPVAAILAAQSNAPIDPRVLEPCPADSPGPIDDLVFAGVAEEFLAQTGIKVAFAEYRPMIPKNRLPGAE